jgi:uncharacterized phage-associated protein
MGERMKKAHDFSVTALRVVQEATGQIEPKPTKVKAFDAKALGHLGGLKGGKARAEKLTPEMRKNIALKAAWERWGKLSLYDEVKATQVGTLLLDLNNSEMDYLKFVKLLYNIERESINRWTRPLIFDELYSMPHGQATSKTLDRAKPENQGVETFWRKYIVNSNNTMRLIKNAGTDKLSRAEISLIKEISERYKNKTASQMIDEHHNLFSEWKDPGNSSIRTTYDELLKVLGKTDEQIQDFEIELNRLRKLKEISQ